LVIAGVVLAIARGTERAAEEPASAPTSSRIAATTTSIAEEDEVVARLHDILEARDRAYRDRDVDLLKQIYTADCTCLRGDGDAIRQLLKDNAVWIGASTSVRINKLEKENDRLWVVVADFVASAFRIETESGDLIRAVGERSEPFRFVLVRKSVRESLLLGFAAPIDESD
jgi:hypothetical protein